MWLSTRIDAQLGLRLSERSGKGRENKVSFKIRPSLLSATSGRNQDGRCFEIFRISFQLRMHGGVCCELCSDHELTRLNDALKEVATIASSLSQVVDLKFFCGFSFVEIATMEGISERTVQRKWEKARLYLHRASQSRLWPHGTFVPSADSFSLDRQTIGTSPARTIGG